MMCEELMARSIPAPDISSIPDDLVRSSPYLEAWYKSSFSKW